MQEPMLGAMYLKRLTLAFVADASHDGFFTARAARTVHGRQAASPKAPCLPTAVREP